MSRNPYLSRTPQPVADPRFGLSPDQVRAVAEGWRQLLRDNGLELLASEAHVVNDDLRLAGSLDRLARTTRPLTFQRGDTPVVVPADVDLVLDIKSSALNPDADGLPSYWDGYPIQIEAYRGGRPYDVEFNERGEWERPPSSEHALIAHVDVDALAEGRAVWSLFHVDLDVARFGIDAVRRAREYHARSKFAASATTTVVEAARVGQVTARNEVPNTSSTDGAIGPSAWEPSAPRASGSSPDDPPEREALRQRKARMKANAHDAGWGPEFDRLWRASGITPQSTNDEVRAVLDEIEPPFDPPPSGYDDFDWDEGGPVDERALDTLMAHVANADQREVLNRWLRQAGHGWSPKLRRTVRSFEIGRAALAMALATDGAHDPDQRDALALAILTAALDSALAVTEPGRVLNSLSIDEARSAFDVASRVGEDLVFTVGGALRVEVAS